MPWKRRPACGREPTTEAALCALMPFSRPVKKKKRSGLLIGNMESARLREILQALVGRGAGLMAVAFVL